MSVNLLTISLAVLIGWMLGTAITVLVLRFVIIPKWRREEKPQEAEEEEEDE